MRSYGRIGIVVLAFAIAGCGSSSSKPSQSPMPSSSSATLAPAPVRAGIEQPVDWKRFVPKKATVSRSQRFGSASPFTLGTFEQPEELELFAEGMRTAEKLEGTLDVAKPEYDLVLEGEDGRSYDFHLWLGSHKGLKGMYMYVSDTGTGYTMTEEMTDRLRAIIQALPYDSGKAEANGEITWVLGKVTNLESWELFRDSVNAGTPGEAHITTFTIEGDPIFQDLFYDGQRIEFNYDNSRDKFGTPIRRVAFCERIASKKTDHGARYTLTGCDREEPGFYLETE